MADNMLPMQFLLLLPLIAGDPVEVMTLDRAGVAGDLAEIGPEKAVLRVGDRRLEFANAEILQLRWPGRQREKKTVPALAELWNGDLLRGQFQTLGADRFSMRLASGSVFEIRIEALRRLVLPKLAGSEDLSLFQSAEGKDRLYPKKKGASFDFSNGTFESFEGDRMAFRTARGQVERFPLADLAALALTPLDVPAEDPGLAALLEFLDGSRITGKIVALRGERIELQSPAFGTCTAELRELLSIRFKNGKYIYLSDLDPVRVVESSPFGADAPRLFPYQKNRSVGGRPLRVGGVEYSQGLGVHSRCELYYELKKAYRTFRVSIAIDDEVNELAAKGSVVFRVKKDGVAIYESPIVRGGSPAIRVPDLDISGADMLLLEVDYADDLHVADRADWLDPLLVP